MRSKGTVIPASPDARSRIFNLKRPVKRRGYTAIYRLRINAVMNNLDVAARYTCDLFFSLLISRR